MARRFFQIFSILLFCLFSLVIGNKTDHIILRCTLVSVVELDRLPDDPNRSFEDWDNSMLNTGSRHSAGWNIISVNDWLYSSMVVEQMPYLYRIPWGGVSTWNWKNHLSWSNNKLLTVMTIRVRPSVDITVRKFLFHALTTFWLNRLGWPFQSNVLHISYCWCCAFVDSAYISFLIKEAMS